MKKILSVSVAAYNVSDYIEQNLRSFIDSGVLDQVEILVTDDGSTDNTAQIVSVYAEQYPDSIRLIRKKNEGAGSTVNSGIEHATGTYFRMVDGDDWVDPAEFAKLVRTLSEEDADMVICDYTMVDDKTGKTVSVLLNMPCSGKQYFSDLCRDLELDMHNVVFRTTLLQENGVRLFPGYYTDVQYLLFPVPYVKTVLVTSLNVYQYRVSLDGQSMNPVSMQKHVEEHAAVLNSLIALYELNRDSLDANVSTYLLRRTVKMSGTHLGILLSFPTSRKGKRSVMGFLHDLRTEHPQVWQLTAQFSSVRLLSLTKGVCYSFLSHRYRKKAGLL